MSESELVAAKWLPKEYSLGGQRESTPEKVHRSFQLLYPPNTPMAEAAIQMTGILSH